MINIFELLEAMKKDPGKMAKVATGDPTWCAGDRVTAHGCDWILLVQVNERLFLAAPAGSTYPAPISLVKVEG